MITSYCTKRVLCQHTGPPPFTPAISTCLQAAELKFNCFFLMPLVDVFPARLRKELEQAYEEVSRHSGNGAVLVFQ